MVGQDEISHEKHHFSNLNTYYHSESGQKKNNKKKRQKKNILEVGLMV